MTEEAIDRIAHLISNQRRRVVIQAVARLGHPASIDDLALLVAAEENDKSVDEVSSSERKNARVGLYQNHVPQLAEAGIVEADDRYFEVKPGPNMDVALVSIVGIEHALNGSDVGSSPTRGLGGDLPPGDT